MHLCCKDGVHISFSFSVIAETSLFKLLCKHHLTKMAAMTFEIGSRSLIFELNLALHVLHLCCKDGVHISFCFKLLHKHHLYKDGHRDLENWVKITHLRTYPSPSCGAPVLQRWSPYLFFFSSYCTNIIEKCTDGQTPSISMSPTNGAFGDGRGQ